MYTQKKQQKEILAKNKECIYQLIPQSHFLPLPIYRFALALLGRPPLPPYGARFRRRTRLLGRLFDLADLNFEVDHWLWKAYWVLKYRLGLCTRPRFLRKFSPLDVRGPPKLHFPGFHKLSRITAKGRTLSTKCCLSVRGEGLERFEHSVGDKDAVIIVDHGSRRQESNFMLDEFVAMFKARTGYRIVEPAHMELAAPSIRDAFETCVLQGAKRVIVSPFFLSPGRHWHQDIPALAAEASREHSGISYIITAPLGLHELMVDVMNDRIKHCLSHVAADADECTVCAGTGKCRLY